MARGMVNDNSLGLISSPLMRAFKEFGRRGRQLRRLWAEGGSQRILNSVKRAVVLGLGQTTEPLHVRLAECWRPTWLGHGYGCLFPSRATGDSSLTGSPRHQLSAPADT